MRIHRKTIALVALALALSLSLTACGAAKDTAPAPNIPLDGRNAVIIEYGDEFYIIVEDGTSVFEIKGICDRKLLYEMAREVIS